MNIKYFIALSLLIISCSGPLIQKNRSDKNQLSFHTTVG